MTDTPKKARSGLSEAELTEQLAQALFGANRPKIGTRRRGRINLSTKRVPGFELALQDATERAAVNARFFPSEIVAGMEQPVAEAVLSSMLPVCDVELDKGRRVWMLGRERRRKVLAELGDQRSRLLSLIDRASAHEWDDAGTYLQELLCEKPLRTPSSLPKMRALAQAYDWVSGIRDVGRADQALRQAIAFKSLINEKGSLLRKGFFGRAVALDKFKAFISGAPVPGPRPPILAISGIGGSGKSTFLAVATRDLLRKGQQGGPAIFQIDFDRFGLGANSTIELTFEITRQIALYAPSSAEQLASLRADMRARLAEAAGSGASRSSSFLQEISFKFESDLMQQLHDIVSSIGWRQRDVILILDTFEELQAKRLDLASAYSSGAFAADRIASWIRQLAGAAGLGRLRVVISGRASVEKSSQLAQHVVDEIVLRDLDPSDAVKLLMSDGLSVDVAGSLQELVGGNPLMLLIGARLIRKLPNEKRAAVLGDLSKGTVDLDKELVQGVLYGRILEHIRDDKARKLAHPGLVLRRVTWRLIRDVLAEPCGLGEVDENEAKRLFEALADEVWLVERDARRSDVLMHRSDIRRMMLRLMAKEDASPVGGAPNAGPARTLAIHQGAVDFYTRHADQGDDAEVCDTEAFYHRMMMVDETSAAQISHGDIERVAGTFGGDVDLLTPSLRLRVLQLSGKPLSVDEAVLLPEDDWRLYAYREGVARLDQRQEPVAALALVERRAAGREGEAPEWQLRALDASARWDEVSDAWLERVRLPSMSSRDEASENWARHSAAKSLLLIRQERYASAMAIANGVLVEMRSAVRGMARDQNNLADHLRCANYALLARAELNRTMPWEANVMFEQVPADWPFEDLPRTIDSQSLDLELRRYIALTWRPGGTLPVNGLGFTVFAFVPDPEWLEAIAKLARASDLPPSLAGLQPGASTADILGRFASSFSAWLARSAIPRKPPSGFDPSLLCGEYPEMRPAAKFALRQAFPSAPDLKRLAEVVQPLLPIVPRDLQPGAFANKDLLPGQALSQLVEYADRSRVLPKVLNAAAIERPASELLQKVARSVVRWDAMFAGCIAANQTDRIRPDSKLDLRWPGLPFVERATEEATRPEVDLRDRAGYDSHFLGEEVREPKMVSSLAADSHKPLNYCRFSIRMSRRSRLPIFAAANIGKETMFGLPQSVDVQAFHGQIQDPRLPPAQQPLLKRGRSFAFAVSPEALAYGRPEEVIKAISDTRFAPNHVQLPAKASDISKDASETWHGIEQRVTNYGGTSDERALFFTGVVQQRSLLYWKVIVTQDQRSGLSAFAFRMWRGDESSYTVDQLPLTKLESIVGLKFDLPPEADFLSEDVHLMSGRLDIRRPGEIA